ncbi:hypothetical protein PybrP1_011243 [[Pythium] brassicae (nom. inval.)]|nr:hypothetical protein PybrP1_011243 [[Pythium] brassicae (nom. inval.)]
MPQAPGPTRKQHAYTIARKLEVLAIAEVKGAREASCETRISRRTIRDWLANAAKQRAFSRTDKKTTVGG